MEILLFIFILAPIFVSVQRLLIKNTKIKNFISYWQDKEMFAMLFSITGMGLALISLGFGLVFFIWMFYSVMVIILLTCTGDAVGEKVLMCSGRNMAKNNILRLFVIYFPTIVLSMCLSESLSYVDENYYRNIGGFAGVGVNAALGFIFNFITIFISMLLQVLTAIVYKYLVEIRLNVKISLIL